MTFQGELLGWYEKNGRDLPWRTTKDPYKIWLSEIILQQTRVDQGMPYYFRFLEAYPELKDMAKASEADILRLWQGLGYYSRGRNLLVAARQMMEKFRGFPDSYENIRALKGVGDYTAAAIASFAFGLPYAVVDGNVYRFLSRYYADATPIDSTEGKKRFADLATALLDRKSPGQYNQAIMEIGALICKPKPACVDCPFTGDCSAYKAGEVAFYPVKSKKIKQRDRFFHYLVLRSGEKIFIRRREAKDIWQGLYELPLIETEAPLTDRQIYKMKEWKSIVAESKCSITSTGETIKHKLSHQTLNTRFIHVDLDSNSAEHLQQSFIGVSQEELYKYGMPQLIVKYLRSQQQ